MVPANEGSFFKFWDVIFFDKRLSPIEKMMLLLVERRSHSKGYCYAGNKTLANDLGVNQRTIQRLLESLSNKGFLTDSRRNKHGKTRNLKVVYNYDKIVVPTTTDLSPDYDKNVASTTTNLSPELDKYNYIKELEGDGPRLSSRGEVIE